MKKVYQTIVDKNIGNCLQAAVATVFQKELDQVPNFISFGNEWFTKMSAYYIDNGYGWPMFFDPTGIIDVAKDVLAYDKGVNGLWLAIVMSQKFDECTHAVVVDKDINVVHDPNKGNLRKYTTEDVIGIYTTTNNWYIDTDKTLVIDIKQ